ncbi:ABC transporter substrate-binding protein [Marinobacter algicola]|uniref:ABC transporter substrate-binding protein n=1 Tax=Marinobacter algicola TaxID=236100 RepID=UPI003BACE80A
MNISQSIRYGRRILGGLSIVLAGVLLSVSAFAAPAPIKVGVLVPLSGTFTVPGEGVLNGLRLAIDDNGGTLGGREVQYEIIDSEANPGRGVANMQRLVSGANVDVVVGPVHSGVALAAIKVARESGMTLLIPNAGLDVATRQMCASNIFRTSFSNWQPGYGMGQAAAKQGIKEAVTMAWRYGAGEESVAGFKQGFEEGGGKIIKEIYVPFPSVEFQSQFTEIASIDPEVVYTFFAGGGAVKFVRDYAAAGLKDSVPLIGAGFLTDGTLAAQGDSAEGIQTALHYASGLDNPANKKFQAAYRAKHGGEGDVYAVHGYDAGLILAQALDQVQGNTEDRAALNKAIASAKVDSPRGEWAFSAAHNPVQDMYLRVVRNGENVVTGVAVKALDDPATGCKM